MTPTPTSNINCAVPTRCANCTPSPTPRPTEPTGAGPPRPPTRSSRCRHWCAEATAAGAGCRIDPDALAAQVRLYRSAVRIGVTQTAARSSKLMRKHNALARRLRDRQDDYLRFTTDWRIPPDNNGSERDIRMIKLRQKVSGCLRTLTGAQQFCAIRSYLSTAAKHGRTFFDTLVMLAEGRPWIPSAADLSAYRGT